MTTVHAAIPLLHVARYHGVTPLNPGSPALAQLDRPMSFVKPILTTVQGQQALLGHATYPASGRDYTCSVYLKDFQLAGAQIFGQPILAAALQFDFVLVNNCRHTTIEQLLSYIRPEEKRDVPTPNHPSPILKAIQSAKDEVVRRLINLEDLPGSPWRSQGDAYQNWTQIFDISSEFVNTFRGCQYGDGRAIPFYPFEIEGELNSQFSAHRILAFSHEYPLLQTR